MVSRLDKQRFIESNNSAFMIPKKFEYAPVRRDETETLVQKSILGELELRKQTLITRLKVIKHFRSCLLARADRKSSNVWVFVQLMHRPMWDKNKLYKNAALPNLKLPISYAPDILFA